MQLCLTHNYIRGVSQLAIKKPLLSKVMEPESSLAYCSEEWMNSYGSNFARV